MPARATAAISPLTPRQIGAVAAGAGVFNSQHCFPATQRNYVISPDRAHREQGETLDFFETSTSDAVQVRIEGRRCSRSTPIPRS